MTTDYANDWLAANRTDRHTVAAMVTKDGLRLSVQASEGHYCSPKDRVGPYSSVEVLAMSRHKLPTFGKPSDTFDGGDRLWGWLPVATINAEIERRGGLAR